MRELEREQGDLATKLGAAYGSGDVFVALVDKCYEAKVRRFYLEWNDGFLMVMRPWWTIATRIR